MTRTGWRDEVIGASGLNILAGIWLIIAPWVLGYTTGDPYWNDVAFGAVVGVIALTRAFGAYRESWLSWFNALVGIWIFASAWVLDSSNTAWTNDVILGAIVFVLAIWSANASDSARMVEQRRRRQGRRRFEDRRPITH